MTISTEEYRKQIEERKEAGKSECAKEGKHVRGEFWNNGLGWHWWYCSRCGAAFDKEFH
jgi:hypothetical protein